MFGCGQRKKHIHIAIYKPKINFQSQLRGTCFPVIMIQRTSKLRQSPGFATKNVIEATAARRSPLRATLAGTHGAAAPSPTRQRQFAKIVLGKSVFTCLSKDHRTIRRVTRCASDATTSTNDLGGERLTEWLIAQYPAEWAHAAVEHPFLQGVRKATLTQEQFDTWLYQDYLFVQHFTRFAGAVLSTCPDVENMKALLGGVSALQDELSWFQDLLQERGIKDLTLTGNVDDFGMERTTVLYVQKLQEWQSELTWKELAVAFWAIEVVYNKAWSTAADSSDPYFASCAKRWGSEAFAQYCVQLARVAEEAVAGDEEAVARASEVFQEVLDLEGQFWDMGYKASDGDLAADEAEDQSLWTVPIVSPEWAGHEEFVSLVAFEISEVMKGQPQLYTPEVLAELAEQAEVPQAVAESIFAESLACQLRGCVLRANAFCRRGERSSAGNELKKVEILFALFTPAIAASPEVARSVAYVEERISSPESEEIMRLLAAQLSNASRWMVRSLLADLDDRNQ
ncbi:hypothetical protein CYMTET_53184 [Cymbomonas tetramitiformis]|uniref:Thiaminase-2/PQQC domain-containing protein n=1 Tax=Cymbomonas tetramitiformis TaxID=36881 RepID=A0AAE0BIX6_9CHLO|nr:hypothetical protein CYMTET_53184 [Cymbomonas tetramitiformis]